MSMACYLFEAHSIQSWIFAGGRLRDAVGASRLLDDLCSWKGGDTVETALAAAKLSTPPEVARRAGGGLVLYHGDRAELVRFRSIFALMVRSRIPDLSFADALGEGADEAKAFAAARQMLDAARAVPSPDPLRAGPFVLSTPRTGAPAIRRELPGQGGEFLDAGLTVKRARVRTVRAVIEDAFDPNQKALFPVELTTDEASHRSNPAFPFLGENRYVGLLHADGNGMGAVLRMLGTTLATVDRPGYAKGFRLFSQALAEATEKAVQVAMDALPVGDVWPIRPLILGGDDLSAILRGDCAISFAADFLRAFEVQTRAAFDVLRAGIDGSFWRTVLPPHLSAGAGIVFVKANQPFEQAHALAEDLAQVAKRTAKDWPRDEGIPPLATLAFHRVTTSQIPARWQDVLVDELTGGERQLSMNPYIVTTKATPDGATPAPRIERLDHLCRALADRDVARGPVRTLTPDFLRANPERDWERMLDMARRRDAASASRFVDAMATLGCEGGPFDAQGRTPVLDALNWVAVARGREEDATHDLT